MFYPWWKDWKGDYVVDVEPTDAPPLADQELSEFGKPTVDMDDHSG